MNEILYWLNTTYACGGIICEEGLVIEAAPIYRWMTGKRFAACLQYLRREEQLRGCINVATMTPPGSGMQ